MKTYQKAIDSLLEKVRNTQTDNIIKAGNLITEAVLAGGKVYLSEICHAIQKDLIHRGGGVSIYKEVDLKKEEDMAKLKKGDVLVVSSVSGRTQHVVDAAWKAMELGVNVIAFTSMEYTKNVEAVHPSGKRLYEFVTLALDNCAPAAEAMVEVEGLEPRFAAASGIASAYIMWNVTAVFVENMMKKGYTPGVFKSINFPGGDEFNKSFVEKQYDELGW